MTLGRHPADRLARILVSNTGMDPQTFFLRHALQNIWKFSLVSSALKMDGKTRSHMANFFHHDSPFTMISFHTCTIHMSPITSLLTFARFPSQSEPNGPYFTWICFDNISYIHIWHGTHYSSLVLIYAKLLGTAPCRVPPARYGITFLNRKFP